jgi:putative hemolysin
LPLPGLRADRPIAPLHLGGLVAREAMTAREVSDWQELRSRQYRGGAATDRDRFDDRARAIVIHDGAGAIAGGLRVFLHETAQAAAAGYVGQHFRLSGLDPAPEATVEFGRVCISDPVRAPVVLRLVLALLTHLVDTAGADLLFGVSSLVGADPRRHAGAIAWLRQSHLAPRGRCPSAFDPVQVPAARAAPDGVPALLRAYLSSGAFVGSDVVADRDLDTLLVFTALDPGRVAAARAARLRALAAQARRPA